VGYWDPLGLSKDGDVDVFRRRRESEIKHGRIAMIATIGYMATGVGYRFPGMLSPSTGVSFGDCPGGLEAFGVVPAFEWIQMFIFCGLIDFGLYRQDPARDPGDFENGGILGVPNASGPMSDADGRKRKLNAELANGRLAMFAIMGMLFQNGWTGSTATMWVFLSRAQQRCWLQQLKKQNSGKREPELLPAREFDGLVVCTRGAANDVVESSGHGLVGGISELHKCAIFPRTLHVFGILCMNVKICMAASARGV